jgi:hypothetical protein
MALSNSLARLASSPVSLIKPGAVGWLAGSAGPEPEPSGRSRAQADRTTALWFCRTSDASVEQTWVGSAQNDHLSGQDPCDCEFRQVDPLHPAERNGKPIPDSSAGISGAGIIDSGNDVTVVRKLNSISLESMSGQPPLVNRDSGTWLML